MTIYAWSTTASDNATADASINWQEGQLPSTVNDSARAMMVRLKQILIDLGGATAATGTANSIAVTAGVPFTGYANGQIVAFRATAANTGAASLNVNSIGARQIWKVTASGPIALTGGEIQNTAIYVVQYQAALNSSAGVWLLLNPTPANLDAVLAAYATKTTPVDADSALIIDSEASNAPKRTTWANIKATLKTYFDTLYATVTTQNTAAWEAGSSTTETIVSPAKVRSGIDARVPPKAVCVAWVNFNGVPTVSIRDSYNVSGVTRNQAGDYTITFANALANTNYCVVSSTSGASNNHAPVLNTLATGSVRIEYWRDQDSSYAREDKDIACIAIFAGA